MFKNLCFTLFSFLFIVPFSAHADILSEGWYKVMSANVQVGYYVSRYEYLPKKRQFRSKSFLKTNQAGGGITESLVALSDEGMKPISYQYTSLMGKVAKTIDAKFKKGIGSVQISEGGVKKPARKVTLPKGSFLSSHLALMLVKQGVAVGKNLAYNAVAEEDAKVYTGKAYIKEIKKLGKKDLFRILNNFKATKFVSLMDSTGTIVATKAPLQGITTSLQLDQKSAVGNIPVPAGALKKIFGTLP